MKIISAAAFSVIDRPGYQVLPNLQRVSVLRGVAHFVLAVAIITIANLICAAQSSSQSFPQSSSPNATAPSDRADADTKIAADRGPNRTSVAPGPTAAPPPVAESTSSPPQQFRLEQIPLLGGAELITIFGRMEGLRTDNRPAPEVPLISVVRDTLSDDNPENDRLRYV